MTERPAELQGETIQINTNCGNMYITINVDESGKPCEMRIFLSKSGTCAAAWLDSLQQLLSDLMKTSSIKRIWKHFHGVRCNDELRPTGTSCQQAIAKALERYIDPEFIAEYKEKLAQQKRNRDKTETVEVTV